VHLLDEQGTLQSQYDAAPGRGARPTSGWLPGEVISDTVALPLPAELPPGEYRIAVGMYSPLDGQRLPVALDEAAVAPDTVAIAANEAQFLVLGSTVEVQP